MNEANFSIRTLSVTFIALLLSACSGEPSWLPSSDQAITAVHQAAIDPATWLPAAGAVAFAVTGLDDDVASRASGETPIFGSQERAEDASDYLRNGLLFGMAATAMFAPVDGAYREFPDRRLTANALAFISSERTVEGLKDLVGRERPDESNDKSFPSGHTVKAFTSATLIRRNLEPSIGISVLSTSFNAAMIGAGALTGWARIEADKHYPSDVLTSAALGNFFAQSLYRGLVDDADRSSVHVMAEPDGLKLFFVKSF